MTNSGKDSTDYEHCRGLKVTERLFARPWRTDYKSLADISPGSEKNFGTDGTAVHRSLISCTAVARRCHVTAFPQVAAAIKRAEGKGIDIIRSHQAFLSSGQFSSIWAMRDRVSVISMILKA